jgi:hypothetical protein
VKALQAGLDPRILIGMGLFLVPFFVYWRTLAPGVYGFDSAELATGVYTQGVVHPPGYPLYLLLGRLFIQLPFGDVAYRLNLMSAVFASLTVVLLFFVIDNLIQNRAAAAAAALFFAVSNYFWQMALITEVYTTLTAFLAALLLILSLWRLTGRPHYLLLFSLLFGLAVAVHTSTILFAPACALWILWTPHWRKPYWLLVPTMFALALLGLALPYLYLSFLSSFRPALDYSTVYPGVNLSTLQGLWWFMSGKAYTIFAFGYQPAELPAEIQRFGGYLWRNYLGLGVILGVLGIGNLWRHSRAWTLGLALAFLANAFFFINYRVLDKDTMFLPAYEIWAIFIAFGLVSIESWLRAHDFHPIPPIWAGRARSLFMGMVLLIGLALNWHWVDMSKADGYIHFAQNMLASSEPNSVIVAPWSSAVVLEYYQLVEGQRHDITVINRSRFEVARYYRLFQKGLPHDQIMNQISAEEVTMIDQSLAHKTVYAVEYDPVLARRFEYLPEGLAFRLAAQ